MEHISPVFSVITSAIKSINNFSFNCPDIIALTKIFESLLSLYLTLISGISGAPGINATLTSSALKISQYSLLGYTANAHFSLFDFIKK